MILEQESRGGDDFAADTTPDFGEASSDLAGFATRPRWGRDVDAAVQEAVGLGNDPGLGLLVDLAKRGEYDPWDVDIVGLTDTYLSELDERLDARDLSRVARLIFYAAALIHLKAKALAERQKNLDYEEALEQALADELDLELGEGMSGGFGGPQLRPGDQPLEYGFLADPAAGGGLLAPRDRPVRQRGLTLVDLIHALREYDERLAVREQELLDEPDFDGEIALDECVGSSHQEDLDQDIIDVRQLLWEVLAEGTADRVEVTQLATERRSRAATYLALLFLAQDEEVLLEQETFYDEVWIVRGPYFGEVRAGLESLDFDEDDEGEGGWGEEAVDASEPQRVADADAEDEADAADHGDDDEGFGQPSHAADDEEEDAPHEAVDSDGGER